MLFCYGCTYTFLTKSPLRKFRLINRLQKSPTSFLLHFNVLRSILSLSYLHILQISIKFRIFIPILLVTWKKRNTEKPFFKKMYTKPDFRKICFKSQEKFLFSHSPNPKNMVSFKNHLVSAHWSDSPRNRFCGNILQRRHFCLSLAEQQG
jgi:hypothetical protein